MRKTCYLPATIFLLAILMSCGPQTGSSSTATLNSDTTHARPAIAGNETEQELMKITNELEDADKSGDKKVFEKYLADNYFSTNADGAIRTEEQLLAGMSADNAATYLSSEMEDIQVRESGNTAILSLKHLDHYKTNGTVLTMASRTTDAFIKQNGQWKLMTRHFSYIPAEVEPAKVNPAVYNSYVGEYERLPTPNLIITRDGDKLMSQLAGSANKRELLPINETTFFEKGRRRETTFIQNNQGQTTHASMKLADGQEVKIKKIK